jgi:hypothetical protein
MATGEAASKVFEVVYRPEWVLGDPAAVSAVRVLDCRPLFSDGATSIWVEYFCSVASFVLPLSETEKATLPVVGAMVPKPAGQPSGFILEASRPFLAYSGNTGNMRVARTSPSK